MASIVTDQPIIGGVLPVTLTALFDIGTNNVKCRMTGARFTNVSDMTAFLSLKIKNKLNEVVAICPEGMNLEPGCTFELIESGEDIWFHKNEALYGRTINDTRVEYVLFFGS
jgi:hypothetical protein